jgi:uncharacterized protein with HEPN domain
LDAIRKIKEFTKEVVDPDQFFESEIVFDATLMNFVVLGEVVEKISDDTQETYSEIPWAQVKSFRNILAHNYFGVDAEEVWQIIHDHLPELKKRIQQILKENPE